MPNHTTDEAALLDPGVVEPRDIDLTVEAGWDPQLARTIYNLLHWVDVNSDALQGELEKLETQYQEAVYAELIFMLSHLRYSGEVARRHWFAINEHRRGMEQRMRGTVDLRVALVSYFLEVNRSFRNPKLIEMRVFQQTRASAYWDQLTGLRNYRYFSEHLNQEILRSRITGAPTSLVMLDVDDFKSFNDSYGHQAGNDALARIGGILPQSLGEADVAARYGGEEFVLVLSATPKLDAQRIAERVREAVEAATPQPDRRPVTISLGVATYPADARDPGELVRRADNALYEAKFRGKNRVRLFRQSTRSFLRVDVALDGLYAAQSLEWAALRTAKLSEGGLQFHSSRHLVERSILEFQLDLPGQTIPLSAVGRVVRVSGDRQQGFDVAVQFIEVDAADRTRLQEYLRSCGEVPEGDASRRRDGGIAQE